MYFSVQILRANNYVTDKDIIHSCVDRYERQACKDDMVQVVSAVLAADLLSQNFERQMDLGSFLAEYLVVVSGDNLESGFSGHSAQRCNAKYNWAHNCSDEASLMGMCQETGDGA